MNAVQRRGAGAVQRMLAYAAAMLATAFFVFRCTGW